MRLRQALLVLPLLWALGCAGPHVAIMQRGDDLARQGRWDQAAAEYERALALEPGDPELTQRLGWARRQQAAERVGRARALLQQGDAPAALGLAQEAAWLDPKSHEARRLVADAAARTLDLAEQLVAAGEARRALDLTALVLRATPADARALRLDAALRDQLAAEAHARADAQERAGRLGSALLELAAAALYVPGYRDTGARIGAIKRDLREQLTFRALVPAFSADPTAEDFAASVDADRLRQSLDPALPLAVVAAPPAPAAPAPADQPTFGVRLGGAFAGYAFHHDQSVAPRSCMYVCGYRTEPNPGHAAAEADLRRARDRLDAAESEITRARAELGRWEREVDDGRRAVDRAQHDADRARAELDRCRARPPAPVKIAPGEPSPGTPPAPTCTSEEAAYQRAADRLRAEQARLAAPESQLASARARSAAAEGRREDARGDLDAAAAHFQRTPRTVEVARQCSHGYLSTTHAVRAAVTLTLSATSLQDGAVLFDREARSYQHADSDETFPAEPGRCAEVAHGDPLELPAEIELKHALLTQAVAGARDVVLFAYDRYRQQILSSAEREQAAGAVDEAVDLYVRYLLLGRATAGERARILAYLAAAKGITPAAAANAL